MSKVPTAAAIRCETQTFVTFWKVQHTDWSGGTSWLDVGQPTRFSCKEAAASYVKNSLWNDGRSQWRLVHVCIEHHQNKTGTTEHVYPLATPKSVDENP